MNRAAVLSAYVDAHAGKPFAYGVNDCLLMVAGAVELLTGVDHARAYRGRYSSLAEGKRLIGKTPLQFVRGVLPAIHPSRAGDGDIGAVRSGRDIGFGIFIGAHLYVQTGEGMGILPRSVAIKAFKVA